MAEIPHTLSQFEDGLKNTKQSILLMGSTAGENLTNAVQGLLTRDEGLCRSAIKEDKAVNDYEREIGEEGMEILTRFNPLATDLRSVVGAMKIATNLERVSDEAENIARRAIKLMKKSELQEVRWLEPVFRLADDLLLDSLRSYSEGDVDLALTLYDRDQKLDELHKRTIKKLTCSMESDVENLRIYLHCIFMVRCLERIGDHAVNIGEEVVYIHRAADIRHIGPDALTEEE
ncbi:MAG: phosphate signaling complex protein PhoU [Verrucomicrobiales bacterium]|nr:phosphate signaling complex protein PhoU [Verrucomicrobiales bacterium]